jgi:hypothetical protein
MSAEVLSIKFAKQAQERLFPDNSFYQGAQVDEGMATDQTTCEIPQDEDGDAQTVRNPNVFPLQTITEEDKKKSYELDLIATKPQLVTDLNQALVSYDKRAVKMRKHMNSLETELANSILYGWAPTKSGLIKKTTGLVTRDAHAPGATGVRKRVAKNDVLFFMSLFNDANVHNDGRRRLVAPSYMYEDLMILIEDQKNGLESKNIVVEKGAIGVIYGFQIFMRSRTLTFTNAATPVKKAYNALPDVTDNQGIIFYHPDYVRYAKGNVEAYVNPKQGQFLGGTLNFALRGGGTPSRLSEIGVGALVEDNG